MSYTSIDGHFRAPLLFSSFFIALTYSITCMHIGKPHTLTLTQSFFSRIHHSPRSLTPPALDPTPYSLIHHSTPLHSIPRSHIPARVVVQSSLFCIVVPSYLRPAVPFVLYLDLGNLRFVIYPALSLASVAVVSSILFDFLIHATDIFSQALTRDIGFFKFYPSKETPRRCPRESSASDDLIFYFFPAILTRVICTTSVLTTDY